MTRSVLLDALELAMEELPADQREVFVAHELMGRSFKEMSAATGVSVNTPLSRSATRCAACARAIARDLRRVEERGRDDGMIGNRRGRWMFIVPLALLGIGALRLLGTFLALQL